MNNLSSFSPKTSPFTAANLINKIKDVFANLPDFRQYATANNLKYTIADAALSAFAVFFTQSPSFLDYQTRMQQSQGKNNAQAIFGVHQIPSANQIRNLLDPVPPTAIFPLLQEIGAGLHEQGYLAPLSLHRRDFAGSTGWYDFFLFGEDLLPVLLSPKA